MQGRPPVRLMLYCHDTYGLGHLRRTLAIAHHLRATLPGLSQLVVTGSPVAQRFALPPNTDVIKLPAVVKVGAGRYEARSVAMPFRAVRDLRRDILLDAARHFRPDALLVDHAPAGLKGEAIPTLRYLKEQSPRTRLVLGLREIIDEPPLVRQEWARAGVYELLDDLYDLILVYGPSDLYDVVREYGFSARAAAKTRYTGYLRREPGTRSRAAVHAELGLRTGRLVVVTAGGGGDGYALFRAMLEALRRRPDPITFDCLLVGGPLMDGTERAQLQELARGEPGVHFLDFTDDLPGYLAIADAVVSMGGYNTICEILSFRRPALIVPRVAPRQEQLIRARALSARGLVRMLHPAELAPGRLLREIDELLTRPPAPARPLDLNGLPAVAAALAAALRERDGAAAPLSGQVVTQTAAMEAVG